MRALVLCFVACLVFHVDAFTCGIDPQVCKIIEDKEEVVRRLAQEVADLFERRESLLESCQCSLHSCTNNVNDFGCSTEFPSYSEVCGEECEGRRINYNTSMFRVPPNTNLSRLSPELKESICVFANLDKWMKKLFMEDKHSSWLFFGRVDGSYRVYPAQARKRRCENGDPFLGDCWPFEPRIRPWFIAATTRWKDIVLVIDVSRSMKDPIKKDGDETRLDVSKRVVSAILDTFSTFDYVSIVVFSNKATRLSVDSPLLQATKENVGFLKEQMDSQNASGKPNLDASFSETFDVLTEACSKGMDTCSGCQKVILFLTDGRDASVGRRDSIKASKMLSNIEKYQSKLERETSSRAKIFTFSMGETSDDSIPRQIACRNNGSWSFIGEDTDPLTAMAGYYHFLTNPDNLEAPVWMDPYEDHSGLGTITTVARPVYSKGRRDIDKELLGVVGYDVLKIALQSPGEPWEKTINELRERSQFCNVSAQSPCQLQIHRNAYADGAICVDPISSFCGTPSRSSNKVPCYRGSNKYYKLFTIERSWNQASRRCGNDGGRLVVIDSDSELAFVAGVASPDGSWIGVRRNKENFRFRWLDGRSLSRKSSYWGVGEPNNFKANEACVHVDQRGVIGNLNDEDCDEKLSFICEYKNSKSCAGVVKIPKQGYCIIPPLSECLHEEASLHNAKPPPSAEKLSTDDVMCPLGKPIDSIEAICCPSCNRTDDQMHFRRSALRQC